MAFNEIVIKTSEYRPCIVNGKKALFHRWTELSNVVSESCLRGGNLAGQIKYTLGIVEFEDGTVEEVAPYLIKFLDHNLFNEINFNDEVEKNVN